MCGHHWCCGQVAGQGECGLYSNTERETWIGLPHSLFTVCSRFYCCAVNRVLNISCHLNCASAKCKTTHDTKVVKTINIDIPDDKVPSAKSRLECSFHYQELARQANRCWVSRDSSWVSEVSESVQQRCTSADG